MLSRGTRVLHLVPDVAIPPKFKTPELKKYKVLSCPRSHLVMFCGKMESYAHNDKILIPYFQDILSEASLSGYMHLERS